MITLKTLPQATAQEVFDQVAEHLLTQGKRCINASDQCCYRDENGNKCAAGALVSDEEYDPDIEVGQWANVVNEGIATAHHIELISRLQEIHDDCAESSWKDELDSLASHYELLPYPRKGAQQ